MLVRLKFLLVSATGNAPLIVALIKDGDVVDSEADAAAAVARIIPMLLRENDTNAVSSMVDTGMLE